MKQAFFNWNTTRPLEPIGPPIGRLEQIVATAEPILDLNHKSEQAEPKQVQEPGERPMPEVSEAALKEIQQALKLYEELIRLSDLSRDSKGHISERCQTICSLAWR